MPSKKAVLITGGGVSLKFVEKLGKPYKDKENSMQTAILHEISVPECVKELLLQKHLWLGSKLGVNQMYSALCSIYRALFLIWKSKTQNKARVKITSVCTVLTFPAYKEF